MLHESYRLHGFVEFFCWPPREILMSEILSCKKLEQELKALQKRLAETRKAFEEIREQTEWYRQAVESSPNLIFSVDKEGRIKTWNAACESSLKYGAEIVGAHYRRLFPNEQDFLRVKAMVDGAFQKQTVKNAELSFLGQDGSVWDTVSRIYPVFDHQGDVCTCVFASTDVTGFKMVKDALRMSEERFRDLAELLPQIVFEMNDEGILTFVNQQAFKMTGYTRKDFRQGFEAVRLFVPGDRKRAGLNIARILKKKEAGANEYAAQRKDGSVFQVAAHSTTIVRHGKIVGIRGILFDITEQKRVEAALKKREAALAAKTSELEEVNSALRVLLRQRDRDRADLEEKVLSNVKELVLPYVEKIKQGALDGKNMTYLRILESNLKDIVSPFAHQLSSKYSRLTPTEIQVAHLIREGKTTKEIAELLNSSYRTVESHRHSIRTKLGLKKVKANLRSHLSAL